jgi:MFS family permease
VLVTGTVRDGFMAILMTTVTELDGVGARYAGTALGLTTTLSRLGSLFAPPLGNSLATWHTNLPFAFWAVLALAGLLAFRAVDAERVQELSPQGASLTSE